MRFIIIVMLVFGGQMLYGSSPADTQQDLFLKAMQTELTREFGILKKGEPPVYYLAYRAEETRQEVLEATLGDICTDLSSHERKAAVHVRVGSVQIDNTQ